MSVPLSRAFSQPSEEQVAKIQEFFKQTAALDQPPSSKLPHLDPSQLAKKDILVNIKTKDGTATKLSVSVQAKCEFLVEEVRKLIKGDTKETRISLFHEGKRME